MKATKDHISLETAKLLKDCGVKSEYIYYNLVSPDIWQLGNSYTMPKHLVPIIPAYTWQEILWEHVFEFFGEEVLPSHKSPYIFHTNVIKNLLQQKKYDEADQYFRKNCILIPQS